MADPEEGRGRGRPRAFDEDAVLRQVMGLFWRQRYAGTSMAQVVELTGLSPSSLYQAFGSKTDLFCRAFEHYSEVIGGRSWRRLAQGTAGLADLVAYFDVLETVLDLPPRQGCLAVNTILEFQDPPEPIAGLTRRYRQELEDGLRAALTRAAERDEVPASQVEARVASVVPLVIAYLTIAGSATADDARAVLAVARALATDAGFAPGPVPVVP